MTLNGYLAPKPRKINLKAALKIMRSKWLEGEYDNFVSQLSRVLGCSIEEANAVSKELTWRNVRSSF
jgi:hypothetical protein